MCDLKEKVVFITGAATGIGCHVVRILLNEGVKHVAILDIAEDAGKDLQSELNTKYGANKVRFFKGDVTNDNDLFGVFDTTIKEHGYIDVVINNAGIFNDSIPVYKKEIEINLTALVSSTLKALQLMRKDEGGKGGIVINISSIAATKLVPMCPIYASTKSAVLMFSNCIGHEQYYAKTGVKVITVLLGLTDTPIVSLKNIGSYDDSVKKSIEDLVRTKPKQKPEHAAAGVVEVCKKGESGSTWLVDKGAPAMNATPIVTQAYDLLATLNL